MYILYIEDEPNDARLVERYLRPFPHRLDLVATTPDIDSVLQEQPDLILLDIVLNQARLGFQFVRALREQGYAQPIVAITGLTLPADIEECYAAGCDCILKKPYTIEELAELLSKYTS